MKKNYIIVLVLSMLLGITSCNYLDVVPDASDSHKTFEAKINTDNIEITAEDICIL